MKIIIEVSNEVINEFCEKYGYEKEEVVDGIKDWFSYSEDEEFFREELKSKIFNV